jgi:hypothetical protein
MASTKLRTLLDIILVLRMNAKDLRKHSEAGSMKHVVPADAWSIVWFDATLAAVVLWG